MASKYLIFSVFVVFLSLDLTAQESDYLKLKTGQEAVGREVNEGPIKPPKAVVSEGLNQAQEKLRTGNVLSETDTNRNRTDEQFKLRQLQEKAKTATANVSDEQRLQQMNLGASILPYIAPWINSIAEQCMNAIKLDNKVVTAQEASRCSEKAVKQYQDNPTAFLNRMPASDRAELEKIIKDKLAESIKEDKNKTGQPQP